MLESFTKTNMYISFKLGARTMKSIKGLNDSNPKFVLVKVKSVQDDGTYEVEIGAHKSFSVYPDEVTEVRK